jgi:hypothetical protein
MRPEPGTNVLLGFAITIGVMLEILCLRTASSFDIGVAFLFLWGMTPYLVLLAVPRLVRSPTETIGAIVATVAGDSWGRIAVLFPTSSTAAMSLLWLPFWLLLVFIPLGVYAVRFVAWLHGRMHGSPRGV